MDARGVAADAMATAIWAIFAIPTRLEAIRETLARRAETPGNKAKFPAPRY